LIVFEMTAPDHEDQRLAASLGYAGEIVCKVRHGLEIDIELKSGNPTPLLLGGGDANGPNRRATPSTIDVQQCLEDRYAICTSDTDGGGGASGVRPTVDPDCVRPLPSAEAHVP
jgi:hypothetical protein